jgi:hypothetical protein
MKLSPDRIRKKDNSFNSKSSDKIKDREGWVGQNVPPPKKKKKINRKKTVLKVTIISDSYIPIT